MASWYDRTVFCSQQIFAYNLASSNTLNNINHPKGGAFTEGSNRGPYSLYDGTLFVETTKNIALVSCNYRLDVLGFLVSDKAGLKGNFGLMDQRECLAWVQSNGKAFGIDTTRVTLWGESAGAMSITAHMASPKSKGLFQSAVLESAVRTY